MTWILYCLHSWVILGSDSNHAKEFADVHKNYIAANQCGMSETDWKDVTVGDNTDQRDVPKDSPDNKQEEKKTDCTYEIVSTGPHSWKLVRTCK